MAVPALGAVAVAVVAEDTLDGDVALGVPGDGAAKEGGAVAGAFACEQLGVGEPRVVVGPPPHSWTAGG